MAIAAIAAGAVILREGPATWWLAAIAGHVGSALLAYALIAVASLLGSDDADRAADDPDFGVSCVLGASLGALLASAVLARREGARDAGTTVALAAGLAGAAAMLALSAGWLDAEHGLSVALGAAVAAARHRPGRAE